jgi:hypothetical protein
MKIKINEKDLRKFVRKIMKETILEDVNELSPELVKKARHQAYKGAKDHEYGRKAYNMGNDTIGDYQAGPIEKKLGKQVDTFRKGEEQRKGHPFYDPKHPEYQQHSKKGGKVHPDYKLTNLIDPHQEGKDDVKELGATLKTLGGIAKAVGQGAKAVGKGAKDVVKKALEPAGEPHWDKSGKQSRGWD